MNIIEFLGKLMDNLGSWNHNMGDDNFNEDNPGRNLLIEFKPPASIKPIIEVRTTDKGFEILLHHGLNLEKALSMKYFDLHFLKEYLVITGQAREVEYSIYEKIRLPFDYNTINNIKHYPMYIAITLSRIG